MAADPTAFSVPQINFAPLAALGQQLNQRNQPTLADLAALYAYGQSGGISQPTGALTDYGSPQGVGKGSWYSQYLGTHNWVDPQDKPGSNALGVPDYQQGIALPSRSTLGQWFDVTAPNGQVLRLQQTDIGPAKWTGRGIDISAAAGERFGYSPQTFPTGGGFAWAPVK